MRFYILAFYSMILSGFLPVASSRISVFFPGLSKMKRSMRRPNSQDATEQQQDSDFETNALATQAPEDFTSPPGPSSSPSADSSLLLFPGEVELSTMPSDGPSTVPSDTPSMVPSDVPSMVPSDMPSMVPSVVPTESPTKAPSLGSDFPSIVPTGWGTSKPTGEEDVWATEEVRRLTSRISRQRDEQTNLRKR